MSSITTTMQSSSFQSCDISEESYCAPWDLKIQEEKLKLFNEQRQASSSSSNTSTPFIDKLLHSSNINNQSTSSSSSRNYINKSCHQPCSTHTLSSTKKSLIHLELTPPELPPLPPGGLIPSFQCGISNDIRNKNPIIENLDLSLKKNSHCLNLHKTCSRTDTSRSFLFALTSPSNKRSKKHDITATTNNTQSMPFETSLLHFKHLSSSIQNNSLHKIPTNYERPWDKSQTSFINNLSLANNRNGGSLQKMPYTEQTQQNCSPSTISLTSPCQHLEDIREIPIDCYFWYHHAMSRREAENVLQSRPSGSFLVRQSESGNHNDYSLSIRTIKGCMHMRICYSEGFYILGECSRPFSSVSCMIKYFSQISVPIRGAAHIKLGTPVLRWEILTSSSLSNEELL
ncbi:unnamed protein product [Rotaria sp. Silwood1]|nr:unnamed protein product [Rotaria sp. Silwood1]CAF0901113.1 unnamed protein product [Rotaria sp. Silwood1]CAF3370977.1 unnamed protein product [Rotaria sp. Silwood1]CAF3390824.1 unnamed protein product [Rotaria sp. Silwood1]CAF4598265.1 unnamed protein product [Rotaria sp. Silwood1]